jgi:uncharacterized protein (DUF305 family)
MQKVVILTLVGLFALVFSGCTAITSGGNMAGMDHSTAATQTPMAGVDNGTAVTDTQAMTDGGMSGMDHGSMTMDPSQPFDAQFIDSMIEHHQGAIEMAQQALEQAEHAELQQMAEDIVAAQTQEIEQMTSWRQAWYPDLAPTGGMDMGMGEMMIADDASKPFDQRFIEAMISHHQGAIEMAQMAQQMAEHQEIQTLADAIIAAQQTEIEQMQGWLQEWYGVSQ